MGRLGGATGLAAARLSAGAAGTGGAVLPGTLPCVLGLKTSLLLAAGLSKPRCADKAVAS